MPRVLLLALVLSWLAACPQHESKLDQGPPCEQVVDHMLVVMKQGLTGHDDVQLGNRKQMIEHCQARNMSSAHRKCLAAATRLEDLSTCQKQHAPRPAKNP
jgi:hypothetical protein